MKLFLLLSTYKLTGGSTAEYMKTYIQPLLKLNLDRFIIHVGKNDLTGISNPEKIAKSSKINTNELLVSGFVLTGDDLNGKRRKTNKRIRTFMFEN